MRLRWLRPLLACLVSGPLCGCGATVPMLQDVTDSRDTPIIIDSIVSKATCELQSAVQMAILDDIDLGMMPNPDTGVPIGRKLRWLDTWIADLILTITVDERSSLSPGLTTTALIEPEASTFRNRLSFATQKNFSLGLGATGSTTATRKDVLEWLIDFSEFTDPGSLALARQARDQVRKANGGRGVPRSVIVGCDKQGGSFIEGDLQIRDWLKGDAVLAVRNPQPGEAPGPYEKALLAAAKSTKKSAMQHEITFVLFYGGNITPSWKLLRVSANQGSTPFLAGQRTRTQDLILTIGPPAEPAATEPAKPGAPKPPPKPVTPSTIVQNLSISAQIGLSVRTGMTGN